MMDVLLVVFDESTPSSLPVKRGFINVRDFTCCGLPTFKKE